MGGGEKSGVGLKRTKFQIVPTMDVHVRPEVRVGVDLVLSRQDGSSSV